MKTAISIPDPLFKAAERLAKKKGLSRSQLYVRAIERFLSEQDRKELTERMNKVCEQMDTSLDPAWARAQARAIGREDW